MNSVIEVSSVRDNEWDCNCVLSCCWSIVTAYRVLLSISAVIDNSMIGSLYCRPSHTSYDSVVRTLIHVCAILVSRCMIVNFKLGIFTCRRSTNLLVLPSVGLLTEYQLSGWATWRVLNGEEGGYRRWTRSSSLLKVDDLAQRHHCSP